MKEVYVKTRKAWRDWLERHHDKSQGIWLVFYKKHTGKPTLEYNDAVEEALCYGWIDSIIKKIDDEKYVRKLTPRKADSRWSDLNKQRVKKLMQEKRMTKFGSALVTQAKKSRLWDDSGRPTLPSALPEELASALKKNKKAKQYFEQLAPSYKKQFIGWIAMAKRQETRDRRVKEAIELLKQGRKLGMK